MAELIKNTLCPSTCGGTLTAKPLPDFTYLADGRLSRKPLKSGTSQIVLLPCDFAITDPSDIAEWEALKAAGQVVCSPKGYVDFGTPSSTTIEVDACGTTCVTETTQSVTFRHMQRSCDGTDYKAMNDWYKDMDLYRAVFVDCNGMLEVPIEWADYINGFTTDPPANLSFGFPMSALNVPYKQDNSGGSEWVLEMQREIDCACATVAIDGFLDAVCCIPEAVETEEKKAA